MLHRFVLTRRFLTHMILSFGLFLTAAQGFSGYQFPKNGTANENDSAAEELKRMSRAVGKLAKKASGALVFISVSKTIQGQPFNTIDPFEYFFGIPHSGDPRYGNRTPQRKQEGLGSGFIVDLEKGYIVTNNHVIESADEISLKFANGKVHDGEVLGRDANTDIAIVKIKDKNFDRKDLTALSFASKDELGVGDFVVALGAPFGLQASISFGVVSAVGRGNLGITELGNFIQTDAAINPGNSGGPLLDMSGDVVGVNSAIFSKSGAYNGIGFAVPASLAMTVGESLINDGKVSRGFIGVELQPIDKNLRDYLDLKDDVNGAVIANVKDGGPAEQAGILPLDVVIAIDGKTVQDYKDISNTIGLLRPGSKVELTVLRNKAKKNITVVTASFPDQPGPNNPIQRGFDDWGLSLGDLNQDAVNQYRLDSREGALVVDVKADGIASRSGLQVGDLIISVNNQKVSRAADFQKVLSKAKKVLLRIERSGKYFYVSLRR